MSTYKLSPEMEAKIPQPPCVCIACLEDKANTRLLLRHPTIITTYCSHSFSGAIVDLQLPRPLWMAYAPLSRVEWDNLLAESAADLVAKLGPLQ